MADFTFRVTPERLREKSGEFSDIVKNIKRCFEQVEQVSAHTKAYWQGEAGDRDRESYTSYKDDISYIVRRLEEHPIDLLKMAGIYTEAESAAKSTNEQLKNNKIV